MIKMSLNDSMYDDLREQGLGHAKAMNLVIVYSILEEKWLASDNDELAIIANEFVKSHKFLPPAKTLRNNIYELENAGYVERREEKGKCVYVKPLKSHKPNISDYMKYIKNTKPTDFLMDITGGKLTDNEFDYIIDSWIKFPLPDEVINILTHYLFQVSDGRMNKAFIQKVAAHWSRKEIKTAEEAIDFAKRENEIYKRHIKKPRPRVGG